jgi:hypothetical protein
MSPPEADDDEPPAPGYRAKRGVEEITADWVDDDIRALTVKPRVGPHAFAQIGHREVTRSAPDSFTTFPASLQVRPSSTLARSAWATSTVAVRHRPPRHPR